jgi:hypothetical protein
VSAPNQSPTAGQPPGRQSNRALLIVLLSVGLATMLCCGGGVCGGLLFFVSSSKTTLAQVKASIRQQVDDIAPASAQDWMVREQLTRAYTTSLDAVVADKQVIERLGDPVEPVNEPDSLFRRENTGMLSPTDETIEFDVRGPKGAAVVRAVCAAARGGQFSYPWSRATEIKVKFSDGSEINVPPPQESEPPAEPP